MKLWLASLALVASFQPPERLSRLEDARAIMRTVIAFEARIHGRFEGRTPCVRRRTQAAALNGLRQTYEMLASADARRPQSALADGPIDAGWGWRSPTPHGDWAVGPPLPEAEAQAIIDIERAIADSPDQPHVVRAVDPAWLVPPFRLCARDSQMPHLLFSSPSFRGDAAFVNAGFICGGWCGGGFVYALRRTRAGWEIVGMSLRWTA